MGLESEKAFPFDAEKDSMGNYDRVYYADDFARYFRSFISSGIFLKEHDNLQVIANDDMSVTIRPGAIIIDGYHYENTEDIIVQLDPADGVLNRIDRISISWIKEERDAHKIVQKGESSYEPIPPECRRNAEYKDYVLADVYVAAGVIKITQDNITDQRLNTDVCGLAIAFSEIDTTLIFSQLQAFYEKVKSENADWAKEKQEAFDKWFENIKNQLEDDVAANLQKQIGALANLKTTNKSDLVSAINELAEKEIDVLDTMEEVEANTDPGKVAGALALKEEAERNGIDTKLIDGVPHWSARGADTWNPFKTKYTIELTAAQTQVGSVITNTTFRGQMVFSTDATAVFDISTLNGKKINRIAGIHGGYVYNGSSYLYASEDGITYDYLSSCSGTSGSVFEHDVSSKSYKYLKMVMSGVNHQITLKEIDFE